MANVNCYPVNNSMKPSDQLVNSQYIQKILDENVGLIHAIIEKQQQNQEAEDLLKSLHKNLIYLATIADQTTSAGSGGGGAGNAPGQQQQQQHQYGYNNGGTGAGVAGAGPVGPQSQHYSPSMGTPSSVSYPPPNTVPGTHPVPIETVDKKPQSSSEDVYKESPSVKSSESMPSMNVDIDRNMDKCHPIRESPNQQMMMPAHKNNVDIDKECPPVISQSSDMSKDIVASQSATNPEYAQKFEENVSSSGSHMQQNPNIKTDMPPPSQPIGIHQDKSAAMQQQLQPQQQPYSGNQRIMYPGVAPNYNQYNPHFEQNSKFYPPQNMYQQSPYNYQGMYNPYQPIATPVAPPTHYNQHMMNTSLYPQYPYYQQPGMEHLSPPSGVQKEASAMPQQMQQQQQHPASSISQPMYPPPPNAPVPPQSMYPSQSPMPSQQMHAPPSAMPQSIKSPANSESLVPPAPPQPLPQSNPNISE